MENSGRRGTRGSSILLSNAARRNQRLLNIRRYNWPRESRATSNRSTRHVVHDIASTSGADSENDRGTNRCNDQEKNTTEQNATEKSSAEANATEQNATETNATEQNATDANTTDTNATEQNAAEKNSAEANATETSTTEANATENTKKETRPDDGLKEDGESASREEHESVSKVMVDHLVADFDDFQLRVRQTKEKMKQLLSKHDDVNGKLQQSNDESSREDDGKHWEYFQQQNKLLSLAVSKLCKQEGIDVASLTNEYQWNFRRGSQDEF
eukprot:gene16946-18653_t